METLSKAVKKEILEIQSKNLKSKKETTVNQLVVIYIISLSIATLLLINLM